LLQEVNNYPSIEDKCSSKKQYPIKLGKDALDFTKIRCSQELQPSYLIIATCCEVIQCFPRLRIPGTGTLLGILI
jgi:hypothetical protein